MAKQKRAKKSGWANTKQTPHKRHPANYRRIGKDDIEYITVTHSPEVEIDGKKVITLGLQDNVSPKEREDNKTKKPSERKKSYVYPKVFEGKRSALGKELKEFSPIEPDKEKINEFFKTLPREKVKQTRKKPKK